MPAPVAGPATPPQFLIDSTGRGTACTTACCGIREMPAPCSQKQGYPPGTNPG